MYICLPFVQVPGKDPHCVTLYPQSYVRRGLYVYQLEWWLRHFPPEQFLILNHEQVCKWTNNTIHSSEKWGRGEHQEYTTHSRTFPFIDMDLLVGAS